MGLEPLKNELQARDEDIQNLFEYLSITNPNSELASITRANILLMLYNKVEYFFREMLFSIYDHFHDNEIDFFDLKEDFQKIIAGYLFNDKENNGVKKLTTLKKLFKENKISHYRPYKTDLANGNITGEHFKKTLKEYKLEIAQFRCSGRITFHTLKDIRNDLAHGNKGFSEIGKTYVNSDLETFIEDIKRIFLEILDKLEILLNERRYLNSNDANAGASSTQ